MDKKVSISPEKFDAVLFDMDGVVTKTAVIHTAAWKETFDELLRKKFGPDFKPFSEEDYLRYVDGKHREDGVSSFLESRKIQLPTGSPDDAPGFDTVNAVGNLKNERFLKRLRENGVEVYETTVALIQALKEAGVKIAVVTASKNGQEILEVANLAHVFDAHVNGDDAARLHLKGKPAPDTFLQAAKELKADPKRAVVVEDAAAGVEAGKKGGFGLVIGVARSDDVDLLKQHGADVVVRDLGEVRVGGNAAPRHQGFALSDLGVSQQNWNLIYTGFDPDPEIEGKREALCAIGNGYFATRAAAPESIADGVHYPGTYFAATYNRLQTEIAGATFEHEDLVNMPNWLSLTFKIEDGDWFDLSKVDINQYEQKLDIKRGYVKRTICFTDKEGRKTKISQRWFVHMRKMHLAAIQTKISALNWSGKITIRSALDGRVTNSGTKMYARFSKKHLEPVRSTAYGDKMHLEVATNQSRILIAESARTRLFDSSEEIKPDESRNIIHDGYVAQELQTRVEEQKTLTVEKIAALYTSKDRGISEPGLESRNAVEEAPGFHELLQAQASIWKNLWGQFDLFIETTEEHSKMVPSLLLHLHSFHVLGTASPNSIDLDIGIPARGWTGEAYQGHVFWDDLFVFPFLSLRMPSIARSLLAYRYRRLDQARKIARQLDARGARYPWQSGSNGREETPSWRWLEYKQQWAKELSSLEIHVDAAIAYNIWHYYQVTEDLDFMQFHGAEMLFEIARFFATVAHYNPERDRFEIHGVVGPDELHNAYPGSNKPGINNNAYTNLMAAWTLCRALDLLDNLPRDHKDQLQRRLDIKQEEIDFWDKVSRKMFVPLLDSGAIEEFEGYSSLEEFPWKKGNFLDMDKIKEVMQENDGELNDYKVTKQADVLMLFYVLSVEELGDLLERLGYPRKYADIDANVDEYIYRTVNQSTLSRVAHAWVLSKLDRCRSWNLMTKMYPEKHREPRKAPHEDPHSWDILLEALGSDYFDIQGGTTREGIHMGAMAGSIDIVQRCYTGIVTRDEVLWLDPQLPDALIRLAFSVHYRGQALHIDISHDAMQVTARYSTAKPIIIGFRGKMYPLNAGESKTFQLKDEEKKHKAA